MEPADGRHGIRPTPRLKAETLQKNLQRDADAPI
jgi:hypothetical protein